MSTSPDSNTPEAELDLDLQFLPSWAQQSPDANRFAKYTGNEGAERGGRDRDRKGGFGGGGGDRGRRPGGMGGGGGGGGMGGGQRGPRPGGQGGGGPGGFQRRDQGARPGGPGGQTQGQGQGGPRGGGGGGGRFQGGGQGGGRGRFEERRAPLPPPMEIDLNFIPEEKGVESLARQIRLTGRAYPLFDIAFLVLKKPERYHVDIRTKKGSDGKAIVPLFHCGLDETLWLSEAEAIDHVMTKHFATFYQSERIPTDPPKGTYTFVGQCGISGAILGPPNYHDYQNKLRKLHTERFGRMPFDAFKARIKIVKDEEVVKKWLDEASFKTQFTGINIPEPVKLESREEVDKHFRETHLPNMIRPVEHFTLPGAAIANIASRPLANALRRAWDDQMKFPLKVVNVLSQQFARHGLQFFKVNKTFTHVAVARPRYLDSAATPVSDNVQRIVDFINEHPKCTRRMLIEAFGGGVPAKAAPAAEGAEKPAETAEAPPTPEAAALVSDLHWLVHEGHVIEFSNGIMETAKKPLPKPVRPPRAAGTPGTAPAAGTAATSEASDPNAEAAGEVTGDGTDAGEESAASEPTAQSTETDADGSASPTAEPTKENVGG